MSKEIKFRVRPNVDGKERLRAAHAERQQYHRHHGPNPSPPPFPKCLATIARNVTEKTTSETACSRIWSDTHP